MKSSTTIELERRIDAASARVFSAIGQGLLLKSTGVEEATFEHDFREGGRFNLDWQLGGSCTGHYVQIVPDRLVTFTWISTSCLSATNKETQVTLSLSENNGVCLFKLRHEGLEPGFCYDDHFDGWHSCLDDFMEIVGEL
jgi:uncharacterized protein YndB with AHSA1/START domain